MESVCRSVPALRCGTTHVDSKLWQLDCDFSLSPPLPMLLVTISEGRAEECWFNTFTTALA